MNTSLVIHYILYEKYLTEYNFFIAASRHFVVSRLLYTCYFKKSFPCYFSIFNNTDNLQFGHNFMLSAFPTGRKPTDLLSIHLYC